MKKITKVFNGFILPSGLFGSEWQIIKNSKKFKKFRESNERVFLIKEDFYDEQTRTLLYNKNL